MIKLKYRPICDEWNNNLWSIGTKDVYHFADKVYQVSLYSTWANRTSGQMFLCKKHLAKAKKNTTYEIIVEGEYEYGGKDET